jgi:hypothetical protein
VAERIALTIHFVDGSRESIEFEPREVDAAAGSRLEEQMKADRLVIDLGDHLQIIPMSSIKYITIATPTDAPMADIIRKRFALLNARLL